MQYCRRRKRSTSLENFVFGMKTIKKINDTITADRLDKFCLSFFRINYLNTLSVTGKTLKLTFGSSEIV